MLNKISLSFIVPVYNVEKYILDCLKSIAFQTCEEYEIIIVNDGSTDNSQLIIQNYISNIKNVQLINKENEGISIARNVGLQKANGEYVCFIDSDDFYKLDFSQNFLDICHKYDLDVIRGVYGIYDDESKKYLSHDIPEMTYINKVLKGKDFLKYAINEHSNEVVPWLGFYKRDFLLKNNILFPRNISYEEDHLFFLKVLLSEGCKIYQTNVEFYAYRKRKGSATKTPTLKQIEDIIYIVNEERMLVDSLLLEKKYITFAKKYICSSFYQLTSIYGRLPDKDKAIVDKISLFDIEKECIKYPCDFHQKIKIILFTYARWFVKLIYDRRMKGNVNG